MADLGTIGEESIIAYGSPGSGIAGVLESASFRRPGSFVRCLRLGDEYQVLGSRDNTEGDSSQPSLRFDAIGVWRFRWAFSPGSRSISVRVKQVGNASPRPSLVIKANPSVGINSDITTTAGSSTTWITIGPTTINPTAHGATWVELRNNFEAQLHADPCYFDRIITTVT